MSNARIRLPRFVPLGLAVVALLVAGCTPQAVTRQGAEIQSLYNIVFGVAAVIFVFVEALIVYAVLRYRRKPGDTALPVQTHGNNLLEVVWTVIPTAIVAVLFVLSWQTLNSVDSVSVQTDVRIRAVAQRFQWSFEYLAEDGQQVVFKQITPEMYVPVGQTVKLTLFSPDVIHAFYVPQFLFKRDVVPGKENVFDFTVDQPGVYRGQCAELCGVAHDAMQFTVHAVSRDEYQAWLKQQVEGAKATPAPSAAGSPAASAAPGTTPAPPAAGGPTIDVSAAQIAFEQTELSAPANTPFTLKFTNNDAGVPHNVLIHQGADAASATFFDGEIFSGVDTRLYPVPAMQPGTYAFTCKVHPNMVGTLTVK